MKKYFIIILISTICGCTGLSEKTNSRLQGKWEQVFRQRVSMGGTRHIFNFKNDSFKIKINSWTDVIDYKPWEPCYHVNTVEYAAGRLLINEDRIYFKGMYTDSMYNVIKVGCFNVGKFERKYSYSVLKDSAYFYVENENNDYDPSTEIILKKINP